MSTEPKPGTLEFDAASRRASVRCAHPGCRAWWSSAGCMSEDKALDELRACRWTRNPDGQLICGKHKEGGSARGIR